MAKLKVDDGLLILRIFLLTWIFKIFIKISFRLHTVFGKLTLQKFKAFTWNCFSFYFPFIKLLSVISPFLTALIQIRKVRNRFIHLFNPDTFNYTNQIFLAAPNILYCWVSILICETIWPFMFLYLYEALISQEICCTLFSLTEMTYIFCMYYIYLGIKVHKSYEYLV